MAEIRRGTTMNHLFNSGISLEPRKRMLSTRIAESTVEVPMLKTDFLGFDRARERTTVQNKYSLKFDDADNSLSDIIGD